MLSRLLRRARCALRASRQWARVEQAGVRAPHAYGAPRWGRRAQPKRTPVGDSLPLYKSNAGRAHLALRCDTSDSACCGRRSAGRAGRAFGERCGAARGAACGASKCSCASEETRRPAEGTRASM